MSDTKTPTQAESAKVESRRAVLRKAGRFAAVSAPAVTLLLAATAKPKNAMALYL
jgi:hypothetical protein